METNANRTPATPDAPLGFFTVRTDDGPAYIRADRVDAVVPKAIRDIRCLIAVGGLTVESRDRADDVFKLVVERAGERVE